MSDGVEQRTRRARANGRTGPLTGAEMRALARNRLIESRLTPNAISMTGLIGNLIAAALILQEHFVLAGIAFILGSVCDMMDGRYSRMSGKGSPFGAFLDSTLDRLADMAILLGVMLHYAATGDAGTVLLGGIALIASVLTSYAKARAEQFLPSFGGGFLERGERLGVLGLGAVTGYMLPALWFLAVAGTGTVAYRFAAAYRELARLETQQKLGEHPG